MMLKNIIFVLAFVLTFTHSSPTAALDIEYDFIVVGSGAGGGPLACRLAEANFKTLLIEAGNDQGDNVNTSIPAFQGVVAQDPKIRWDVSPQGPPKLLRSNCQPNYPDLRKPLPRPRPRPTRSEIRLRSRQPLRIRWSAPSTRRTTKRHPLPPSWRAGRLREPQRPNLDPTASIRLG